MFIFRCDHETCQSDRDCKTCRDDYSNLKRWAKRNIMKPQHVQDVDSLDMVLHIVEEAQDVFVNIKGTLQIAMEVYYILKI